jgi:very-short-patch-repair endonuclease
LLTFKRARSLRRQMTLPEVLLRQALRGEGLGRMRFRRQHPLGPYILDFYCSTASLAIEVDGMEHTLADRSWRDEKRDHWLNEQGVRVLRFAAADALNKEKRREGLATIGAAALAPSTASGGPPSPFHGGG